MLEMAKIPEKYTSNADFLLSEYGIATVNGIFCGTSSENYVRLSLTRDKKELEVAVERLSMKGHKDLF